jgi:carbon starvation protein CstA
MISLWTATAYLLKTNTRREASLLTALPAAFMSAVSMTSILLAKAGFRLSERIAWPVGVCFAAALFVLYLVLTARHRRDTPSSESL